MDIPIQHLSVRIPWHDTGWNGKVCALPRENGSCIYLPRISEGKDIEREAHLAGQWIHNIQGDIFPHVFQRR